jgi:HTH-type transcriptional regulator/antitoxin MqsA
MSGIWHGKPCPICGNGILYDGQKTEVTEYRGRQFTSSQTGAFCDSCADGIVYHDPAAADAWEQFRKTVHEDERRELVAVRQSLGLTQQDAVRIAGGGHNAFSRYERGEAHPVLGVVNLFRLLGRYPQLLLDLGVRPRHMLWTNCGIYRTLAAPVMFAPCEILHSVTGPIFSTDYACTLHKWSIDANTQGNISSEETDVEVDDAAINAGMYWLSVRKGTHHGAS